MSIGTTKSQVAAMGDDQKGWPSGILVDERASHSARARKRGNLYALAEVSGPPAGRDIFTRHLLEVVRDAYYRWQGSVTAGLQEAVRAANGLIVEDNRDSLPGEQRTAGITCAVLRENDLFVAQAGPACIYLAHEGKLTRVPDISPWLEDVPLEERDATPLGARHEPNVALFHIQVDDGDMALLVETALARRLSPLALSSFVSQTPSSAIPEALLEASEGEDLASLVVKVGTRGATQTSVPALAEGEPAGAARTSPSVFEALESRERLRTIGAVLARMLVALGAALATLLRRMLPGQVNASSAAAGRATGRGRAQVKKSRVRPEAPPQRDLVQKLLVGAAIAIPLVVAAVVLIVYVERGRTQKAQIDALWQTANSSYQQSLALGDPATLRASLNAANKALNELVKIPSQKAKALDLQSQVQARLDEINQVRRITTLTPLKTYPADAKLSRVVVEDGHIFVMDRNSGKVYHHQLDRTQQALDSATADTVLVSKGQRVGDTVVSDLVDMVWIPSGEGRLKGALGILDSGSALLQYDPTTDQLTASYPASYQSWKFARLVGGFSGRLYVLDTSASKIWRYQYTADGYSSPPYDWLTTPVTLTGAIDMAIGNSIYILLADGQIRRFTTGNPDTLDISDWDTPPSSPGALFTRSPDVTQWVYLADNGNQRIVQFSVEGRFHRQFQLVITPDSKTVDPLTAVSSLFVDEISGHAFFLSGKGLYMAVLPQ